MIVKKFRLELRSVLVGLLKYYLSWSFTIIKVVMKKSWNYGCQI